MSSIRFKTGGKEYSSKPFDFKAMCMVNERHNDEDIKGPLMMCKDAVEYLFDGTDGAAVLAKLPPGELAKLCVAVWQLYITALETKNE